MNDLALVDHEKAESDLPLRPVEGPVGCLLQSVGVHAGRERVVLDQIAVRPRDGGWVTLRHRHIELRQALDVLQALIRRHDDTADPFAEGRANGRSPSRPSYDHRLEVPIDDVVPAAWSADRLWQKGQLLSENLFESPVGCEQAVTHEDGLLAMLDHVPVESPIVVRFLLLGASSRPGAGARKRRLG